MKVGISGRWHSGKADGAGNDYSQICEAAVKPVPLQ